MGSGKSTVGAALAELLGWAFVDLDTEIVLQQGRSIAEIFQTLGEPHFRQLESDVLQQVFRQTTSPAVIALGGGTFVHAGNRETLRSFGAMTVYLEGSFDLLLSRCCTEEGTRPLMKDPAKFRQLFEDRQADYRLADAIVQVAGRSPQQIARDIVSLLTSRHAKPAVPE